MKIPRRDFITLLGGVTAWPLAARAQQPDRMRRIGVPMVYAEGDPEAQARIRVLLSSLEGHRWMVGRNLQIDYRWYPSNSEEVRAAAEDLVRLAPDVIVVQGSTAVTHVRRATSTIPIVFVAVTEPVALGLVQSLARPGGNATGFTNLEPTVGPKWLELLKEIAPPVTRVVVMFNPETSTGSMKFFQAVAAAAAKFAVQVTMATVRNPAEIESVITRHGGEPGGGLIMPIDAFNATHRKLIIELAARFRLPAIYPYRFFAADGGLIAYGIDGPAQYREAAGYVDRILRGEKPADLPVQQPTKFELVINLKTAKTLGLTFPPGLLAIADEVIE